VYLLLFASRAVLPKRLSGGLYSRSHISVMFSFIPMFLDKQQKHGKEWEWKIGELDRAGSYMVNMGDSVAHAYFPNHRYGSFCDNGISWGSCKKSSHARHGKVTVWPVNALSWRKHVAYRL
jgi:hypothetical protein